MKMPNCVRYKMIQERGEQGWPHPSLPVCKYAEIQNFSDTQASSPRGGVRWGAMQAVQH